MLDKNLQTALHIAIRDGNELHVAAILESPSSKKLYFSTDSNNEIALHTAAKTNLAMVKMLLSFPYCPDVFSLKNSQGYTAWRLANSDEILRKFFEKSCSIFNYETAWFAEECFAKQVMWAAQRRYEFVDREGRIAIIDLIVATTNLVTKKISFQKYEEEIQTIHAKTQQSFVAGTPSRNGKFAYISNIFEPLFQIAITFANRMYPGIPVSLNQKKRMHEACDTGTALYNPTA
jgi:hypothetical protein